VFVCNVCTNIVCEFCIEMYIKCVSNNILVTIVSSLLANKWMGIVLSKFLQLKLINKHKIPDLLADFIAPTLPSSPWSSNKFTGFPNLFLSLIMFEDCT
jgi:hypothetical protein